MCHYSLLLCLTFSGIFLKYAAGSSEWCYSGCDHSPSHWKDLPDSSCGETRQSPINIVTSNVLKYYDLPEFHILNLTSEHVIESVANTGHTVKYTLKENTVEVSGGGLSDIYSALQFHFHWGDTEDHPGSEHMINLHRYPMEMHIVSKKKNLAVEEAKNDPEGFAVLGFFIEADKENENQPESWKNLMSYLSDNTNKTITVTHKISLDDLIGSVNRTMFYRYMGSLTTPDCNEAVVWTIFHQPIKISKNLIEMFPKKTALTNVYRPTQALNMRTVFVSRATPLSTSHWCYDDHCEYTPSHWHYFSEYCGDLRQSPVNIDTHSLVTDEHLDALTFTKFNDKQSIKSIINTGHTVKCVLKEGLEVSGGGLGYVYSILQFHFHWGTESNTSEGSEHTVDSKRYPMEMHIVSKRKDLSLEEAKNTPNGLAVLGFFIEPLSTKSERSGSSSSSDNHETNPTSSPSPASNTEAWRKLTNYLSNVKQTSIEVEVTEEISIDDLLGGVSRTVYYRYNGSLTTPTCNEAVVWTVFKESVKVDEKYMKMFPTQTGYGNVFRDVQPLYGRVIYSTASATEPHGAASAPGPCILFLLLACLCIFPFTVHL